MNKQTPEEIKRVKGMGFLKNKDTEDLFSGRVLTENGVLTAAQMECLAQAAQRFGGGTLALTSRLTIELPGIHYGDIPAFQEFISAQGMVTGGTGNRVRPIVACKGTVCQYGNGDTQALATRIHKLFYEGYHDVTLPHKFKIGVGGCPNNCIKPELNDLGIVCVNVPNYQPEQCKGCKRCTVAQACPMGAFKLTDGVAVLDTAVCNSCGRCVGVCPFGAVAGGRKGAQLYMGGRWGKEIMHGVPLSRVIFDWDEVMETIEMILLLYRENGITGERFGSTVKRLGLEYFERELQSKAVLARKQQLLAAELRPAQSK